ncbi:filaggrin-2-like [Arapaima gigas]
MLGPVFPQGPAREQSERLQHQPHLVGKQQVDETDELRLCLGFSAFSWTLNKEEKYLWLAEVSCGTMTSAVHSKSPVQRPQRRQVTGPQDCGPRLETEPNRAATSESPGREDSGAPHFPLPEIPSWNQRAGAGVTTEQLPPGKQQLMEKFFTPAQQHPETDPHRQHHQDHPHHHHQHHRHPHLSQHNHHDVHHHPHQKDSPG